MQTQAIPLLELDIQTHENTRHYSKSIFESEIKDIHVAHIALAKNNAIVESFRDGYKTIYLFLKGKGDVVADNNSYEIVPETVLLPNSIENITITPASDDALNYLKITCKLSAQDKLDLQALPAENTQNVYHAKFIDCQSYSESIKSPNTVSRTILSNKYIPRIAMGTVQTKGPDRVAAHEHPMLEQLFFSGVFVTPYPVGIISFGFCGGRTNHVLRLDGFLFG